MTLDMGNTDKLNEFRLEARRLGVEVLPPDINRSGVAFEVADGKILYALAALKGLGAQAVEHLVEARGIKGFQDLADFAARIDPQIVNRKSLECLAQAGAFDFARAATHKSVREHRENSRGRAREIRTRCEWHR